MKLSDRKALRLAAVAALIMAAMVAEKVEANTCGFTFFSALAQLMPCRPSVTPFSPIPPSETCCNAVKVLGQPCLCVLLNGPPISGVDRSMAMLIPDKCMTNFGPCEMVGKEELKGNVKN